jgi:predicted ATPase with chaperone activity
MILAEPLTVEQTGLPPDRVHQLLVKTLYGAEATGAVVADRLRLPFTTIEPLIEHARSEHLVEVRGAGGSTAAHYRYALTDLGMERARQFLDINQYIGPAPVPLAEYAEYMRTLAVARTHVDREQLRRGFSQLVVDDRMLEQLGPAVNAARAVFLYGPPGNGKTRLAEGMGRALGGDMYVPHAIDVQGHPIVMFDPISHQPLDVEGRPPAGIIKTGACDRRWVRIRRPLIAVGGELTLDMLELRLDSAARYYEAPVQLKANGGVLLVDDF